MILRSLSSRLIVYAIFGSIIGFVTLPMIFVLGLLATSLWQGGRSPFDEIRNPRTREVVIAALRKDADGEKYIEKTRDLQNFIRENPEFRFAVFDPRSKRALEGSAPELVEAFGNFGAPLNLHRSTFHISVGGSTPKGEFAAVASPVGEVLLASYGSKFRWSDSVSLLYYASNFSEALMFLPPWGAMCLIALFVVNRGLAPLRAAAAKIAKIDVNSLKERIALDDAPSEMRPFVEAVDKAFERVQEGVDRQRRFSANSAHELRTPITILRARVGKMEEGPLKFEIERDVLRVQTIVEQMLLLAQIKERGRIAPHKLDLYDVVLAVAADYVPIAIDNDREIQLEAPSRRVTALGLRWSVESIVTNLIANAVRAEPAGGVVIVRVLSECAIEVVDHGSGVSDTDRDRIFEPFWRKDDAPPGTGLGLSIVRELVDLLGGEVSVEETPGGGATFKVRLPEAGAEPGEAAEVAAGREVQLSLDQRCERNA
ncbi:HAMP domain-containing histidine kinase [Methylosinus sp. H3A]|uniref:sensor histidine kinase n=1 Tax=Methylosinus sp. H3A TaxID=2785786 RepID=UPI0018C2B62D|nr:HAMP domain-containing sensor histidine kinase [Methylosinus sp. H3A]MBG0810857.1 HAMP domain-containing histidine kinase [Methylosinus sp. H3A]